MKVVLATLLQHGNHNIGITTSNLQRCTNVASTLDSKFTLKYNIDATVTISILYSHCDVKFTSF